MNELDSAQATRLLARACRFTADRHRDQKRKGAAGEPYINHLAEVAELVAEATGGRDPDLVAAAYLHDTVEDTATTHAELVERFGRDVADLVAEVTDDKSLPQAERKRLQVEHAPGLTGRAKILKLADKTSNLRRLVRNPPDWPLTRKQDYFAWATAVVAGCRGANAALEAAFDRAHAEGLAVLG